MALTPQELSARYGIPLGSQPVSGTNFVIGQAPTTSEAGVPAPGGGTQRREVPGALFTLADLQAYVAELGEEETIALQEALFINGFYGVIESIEDIADPNNFINALGVAAKEASTQYQWGQVEGMEGVPTAEGRFSEDLTREDLDAAKAEYLKEERFAVTPASAVDRSVEASWASVLGRKPTDAEKRAAFEAVRAAEVEFQTAEPSGMYESFDRLGVIEQQAGLADPRQKAAISMSKSSNLVRRALGLG